MKTIVVVDTQWIGHIPMYHATLVERLLALNCQVISISPKPQEAYAAVKSSKKTERARFSSIQIEKSGGSPLERARLWWQQCAGQIQYQIAPGWEPHLVFFPGIDTNIISQELTGEMVDDLFPYPWSALYLTPKYLRRSPLTFQLKKLSRKDRFFQAKNCRGVAVLDENVIFRLSNLVAPTKVFAMPDFTNVATSNADALPFSLLAEIEERKRGRKVIGMMGELSRRKGLTTLIDVAREAQIRNKDWFFVFAGPLNERNNNLKELPLMQAKVREAPENCLFHLERISEESHFNDLISACDVVYLAYEKFFHSSNLLTKSAYLEKPVVVSKGYCMEERVNLYRTGLAVPESHAQASFKAIDALLKGEDLHGVPLAPQYSQYYANHSHGQLDEFLHTLIKTRSNQDQKVAESSRSLVLKKREV